MIETLMLITNTPNVDGVIRRLTKPDSGEMKPHPDSSPEWVIEMVQKYLDGPDHLNISNGLKTFLGHVSEKGFKTAVRNHMTPLRLLVWDRELGGMQANGVVLQKKDAPREYIEINPVMSMLETPDGRNWRTVQIKELSDDCYNNLMATAVYHKGKLHRRQSAEPYAAGDRVVPRRNSQLYVTLCEAQR